MIYRNSYFRKESRQAFTDNTISLRRRVIFALFMGLVSFSLFFALQTLTESVISDAAPELIQPSFFSTAYIYIHTAILSLMVYYILYYNYLFFSEIRSNAWYLLIHMRYHPLVMIGHKISALLYSTFISYSIGFVFTALLTVFLKYTFVFAYMPSLYIAGLVDIFLLTTLTSVISLFVKRAGDARLLIIATAIVIFVLKAVSGAYDIIRNRVVMQDISNLTDFSRSWYFHAAVLIMLICIVIIVLRAWYLAQYYSVYRCSTDTFPAGVCMACIDSATGRQQKAKPESLKLRRRKLINAAVTTMLIVFILAALALNIFIILIGTATPGNEVTIRGTIPYIFGSDTMQPTIMVNDLAFFRKIDDQYPLSKSDIVLFKHNNIVYVERITQLMSETLEVDIDHYPSNAEIGAMIKNIPHSAVYGVYTGRSRWLGALILFANTIIGRILFLFVPAVLLFYHKRIAALFRKNKMS